jgi:hypothetical protein
MWWGQMPFSNQFLQYWARGRKRPGPSGNMAKWGLRNWLGGGFPLGGMLGNIFGGRGGLKDPILSPGRRRQIQDWRKYGSRFGGKFRPPWIPEHYGTWEDLPDWYRSKWNFPKFPVP